MYKGKDFGTPFKKMGGGVCCLVPFEIRSGSYRVSPAKPGEKLLRHFVTARCGVLYLYHTICRTPEGGATLCHIDNYLLDTK